MGYFSRILTDSKRPLRLTAGGVETSSSFAAETDVNPAFASSNDGPVKETRQDDPSRTTAWEEGGRTTGDAPSMAPLGEPVPRQVVGPSPSEHILRRELPGAQVGLNAHPNPGIRKQTGLKSHHAVTADPSVYQESSSVSSGSLETVLLDSVDTQVAESQSERPVQSAREMSVETRGSRQAGESVTRAGATAPPSQTSPVSRMEGVPQQVSGDEIAPPLSTDRPQITERIVEAAVVSPVVAEKPIQQEIRSVAIEAAGGRTTTEQKTPAEEKPVISPELRSDSKSTSVPPVQTEKRRQPSEQQSVAADNGPAVHIGLLEVIVVSPDSNRSETRRETTSPAGLSSRHYLRNL